MGLTEEWARGRTCTQPTPLACVKSTALRAVIWLFWNPCLLAVSEVANRPLRIFDTLERQLLRASS